MVAVVLVVAAKRSSSGPTSGRTPVTRPDQPPDTSPPAEQTWITAERPRVKFLRPPGWVTTETGAWGVFKSPDGEAVLAFSMFNQPGQSTYLLGKAANVLGVGEVDWTSQGRTTVGAQHFPAATGAGNCNFRGAGGYIWYATVNPGGVDQILMIYTVSARGTAAHKSAALSAINSLQLRD
ncbi:MAG: hypothetical protein HY744_10485 [Deltaproteobacteria bacterium]|nr:hypothetical protein [Deltaproteobacteria bacterium]